MNMRLDNVEIGSANGLYFDEDPISTACRNRVRVEIESDYLIGELSSIISILRLKFSSLDITQLRIIYIIKAAKFQQPVCEATVTCLRECMLNM